mmetsp:Transcript_4668/g.11331  ORF Transcript_4668/g.11331 Transcript_4668/m.11331 type:complete len:246 (+) Transcript_4668:69-806(+)
MTIAAQLQQKSGGTARSRSTSAGSSSSAGPRMEAQYSGSTKEIPEYNYPIPLIVKNTFLDTESWRPSSLDGFFQERITRSCVSRLLDCPEGGLALVRRPVQQPSGLVTEEDLDFFDANDTHTPWASPSRFAPVAAEPAVLRLSDALPEVDATRAAEVAAAVLPTMGSAGHFDGTCKPCAFFHTKGCRQGFGCEFCHLCEAGERKRRRKEKVTLLRQQRAWDNAQEDDIIEEFDVQFPSLQVAQAR